MLLGPLLGETAAKEDASGRRSPAIGYVTPAEMEEERREQRVGEGA
jgi:hypothetical protein